jgi:predicted Zn-dependent protease
MRLDMRIFLFALASFALFGCDVAVEGPGPSTPSGEAQASRASNAPSSQSLDVFRSVVRRMEPVAEQICRNRTRNLNCDFRIVVVGDLRQPPNAFQTLDRTGRPVLGFTPALIRDARNADEIAFVLGHEAAHHISGHIPSTQQQAIGGALLGTVLATVAGADPAGVDAAQRIGGNVAARRFAKQFELEADSLGTVITARAGFNPVKGAQYFTRIPDPGNKFLGTHPPNAQRIETVRRTAAQL